MSSSAAAIGKAIIRRNRSSERCSRQFPQRRVSLPFNNHKFYSDKMTANLKSVRRDNPLRVTMFRGGGSGSIGAVKCRPCAAFYCRLQCRAASGIGKCLSRNMITNVHNSREAGSNHKQGRRCGPDVIRARYNRNHLKYPSDVAGD